MGSLACWGLPPVGVIFLGLTPQGSMMEAKRNRSFPGIMGLLMGKPRVFMGPVRMESLQIGFRMEGGGEP